jgi:iron complex outermembrane recepter protein
MFKPAIHHDNTCKEIIPMKLNSQPRKVLPIAIAASLYVASTYSYGQPLVIEEVLVTAQKRTESSQDIPVALTAINGDTLDQIGIQSTQGLVEIAPSLTLVEGSASSASAFSIRGIGTNTFGIGVEQAVAVLIDDVATVQSGQAMASLIDIERVEILRGPQNTLFGKSASAGVISITTRAPSEELEGSVELTGTDDDEKRISGSISGPMTDTLAYRLTGHWSDRDGYINNLTPGEDDRNGLKSESLRGKLRWNISDTVQMDLAGYYMKDRSSCCAFTWNALGPNIKLLGFVPDDPFVGIKPGDDNSDVRVDDGPDNTAETKGATIRFDIDLGEYTLTSITAANEFEYTADEDVDFGDLDVQQYLTNGAVNGGLSSQSWKKTDLFSQEIRLLSPSQERYEYLVGLYYADADTDRTFFRNLTVAPADFKGGASTETSALFGQLTWRFTDKTSVTGGLRWFDEEVTGNFQDFSVPNAAPLDGKDSESDVIGQIALQHFFTEDVMVYASYGQGYKGQAFDVGANFNEDKANDPVESEASDAYEAGIKSQLWAQRLQLNATVFYATYDNFQVQRQEVDDDGFVQFNLSNVGKLETQGLELETLALLTEDLTLTFNMAYVDAAINDYVGAPCWRRQTEAEGCVDGTQNIDNGTLPISPEWKYTVMADYQLALDSMPFNGFANFLYTWQDDVLFTIDQNPTQVQDSYGIANLRVGIQDKSDRYRLTLFVNNVFDEGYTTYKLDIDALFGGTQALTQVQPRNFQRYWGLQAKFNF